MEVSVQSSNSNHSSAKSELEKEINELELNEKSSDINGSSNGVNNSSSEKLNTLKKRISSSKTPNRITTKARRVRFFRNGDKFWTGYLVAVSQERYK